MTDEAITLAQCRCCTVAVPRTRRDFRAVARWWELEAARGYASTADSLRYAANMRERAAELLR